MHQATRPQPQVINSQQRFGDPFPHLEEHTAHGRTRYRVRAWSLCPGTIRTIAIGLYIYDVGIDLLNLRITNTQPLRHSGPEIVNKNIRIFNKPQYDLPAGFRLEIDAQAAFSCINLCRPEAPKETTEGITTDWLHFDHFGSHICEVRSRQWCCNNRGDF